MADNKMHLFSLSKYSVNPTIVLDGFEPSKHKISLIMMLSCRELTILKVYLKSVNPTLQKVCSVFF